MPADAKTPLASAAAPAGKTTLDEKMTFEPERLSYESADKIAIQIAEAVREDVANETVIIVDLAVLGDFANLRAVTLELAALLAEYTGLAGSAAALQKRRTAPASEIDEEASTHNLMLATAGPAAAVSAVAEAGLGLINLFRQDVEFRGAETKVDSLTFEVAVGARVKKAGAVKVFLSDLVVPPPTGGSSSVRALILQIEQAKVAAWQAIAPLISEVVRLDGQLDMAVAAKDQPSVDILAKQVSELRRDVQPVTDPLSRADRRLSDLHKQWNRVDEKSGLTGLARLLRAETIRDMKAIYLHCAVVASGGHHRIVRNLWRTLFSGDGVSFMAGAVVRWALLDHDGSIRKGGMQIVRKGSSDPGKFSNRV